MSSVTEYLLACAKHQPGLQHHLKQQQTHTEQHSWFVNYLFRVRQQTELGLWGLASWTPNLP